MTDIDRALAELLQRGLITRNDTGAGVTYGVDSAVAHEIARWMQAHPEEKQGLSDERVAGELAQWYAASFEKLADVGGSEASERAAGDARAALQCFLDAQSFGELGAFAGRLVNGTREPELLGQIVDDFTASGVPVLFADYRLRRLVGTGLVSSVYEAERVDNSLPVAVKILRGKWPDEEDDVLRFLDDAKVANRVRHPNVVDVFDAGHTDGTRFVAMELLRGRSLERRWRAKGRRLPLKRVLEIAMHVLGVLAAAHEKSIIHGCIRPSNIFITTDGLVKVLDFGESSLTRTPHLPPPSESGPEITSFLAPEQVRGELPDPRTDLWSVGSTILAMLSGHPADVERATSIAELLPGVASSVIAVLDRALRPARDERWRSAKEMWEAIAAIHGELPEPDEHISDPGPRTAPILDTVPRGPLSERVVVDADRSHRNGGPPQISSAASEIVPVDVAELEPPPLPPQKPRAPAHVVPVAAAAGGSKSVLLLAVVVLLVCAVVLALRISAITQRPPPAPTTTSPQPSADPTTPVLATAPDPSASLSASAPPLPSESTSPALPLNPDGQPSPVTTGNAPATAGDKRNGDRCDDASECKSRHCVDGVCCTGACSGTCVACNLKSFLGQCAEIPYGYDPDKECGTKKACDGDGRCGGPKNVGRRCKSGRECSSGFCVRGICCATECRGTDGNCSSGTCRRSLLIE